MASGPLSSVRHLGLWTPVVMYMGLIFYASSLTGPPSLPTSDKVQHTLGYAALGALVTRALAGGLGRPVSAAAFAGAVVITTAYGVSDEAHQMFVPGRSPEILDIVADAAGGLLGAGVCMAWGIIAGSRPTHDL